MRLVTRQAVNAFMNGSKFKSGNTQVKKLDNGNTVMFLHGNTIAVRDSKGISLFDCGWRTVTTKERLNGILEHLGLTKINQVRGEWYRGKECWNSGAIV